MMNLIPRRVHATSIIMNDMFKNCKNAWLRHQRTILNYDSDSDAEEIYNSRIIMRYREILHEYWEAFVAEHLSHYRVFHEMHDDNYSEQADDPELSDGDEMMIRDNYCSCCGEHVDVCLCSQDEENPDREPDLTEDEITFIRERIDMDIEDIRN